ncbi:hypothetical protein GUITHDRAFT_160894 [Guillardia theta CCMP2712]|uniref:Uncharacterized protein n=1 Tax=Guillardia theta (strain CCMP2712) TaxID=905079 RepID=L1JYK5_GUITC|nr:hypothetical protein GUITHDRAFT_160894 [Guillardia theta CCMP2712]EKX53661.1 hypothetical protein GUITHDRAFT_160894 [Guillardia theta CCMP2712]|eukprot:XP_005840641.1 hypothetical protein GUITHDRAFT_160894 [Guillardia theta CCMP2712]
MNALRAITRVGTTSRACDMFMRAKAKDKQKGQKTDVKKTSKKPKAPADASKKNQGPNKALDLFAKILNDAEGRPEKYIRSEEQMKKDAEIAKEYTRNLFKEHNARMKHLTWKIKWRDAATQALPEELQEEALTEDLELYPLNRRLFTDFPPAPEHVRL